MSPSLSSELGGGLDGLGTRPPWSSFIDLTAGIKGWGKALALSRSPRQTIQVSDILLIDQSEF